MSSITAARGRRRGAKTITVEQRAAIITLRFCCNLSYPEISSKLSINDKTCSNIYREVERRVGCENPTLIQLLQAVGPIKQVGRPVKVQQGSSLSAEIRADILRFYDLKPIDAVAQALRKHGITLSLPTIKNIMLDHRDERHPYAIVRGSQLQKPALDDDALDDDALDERRNYSKWLIREFNLHFPRIVFVSYDEISRTIGGSRSSYKPRISRPRGADPYKYARPTEPPKFTLMICAATSSDTNCSMDRPCVIWEADTPEQSQDLRMRVTTANQSSKERIKNKQVQATIPGTAEERALREINSNLQRENKAAIARNREAGKKGASLRKGTHYQLKPEQFFKQEEFLYKEGKGMSGLWYAENILKKHLFPYYNSVREHNPGKRIYLIQDNVHLHGLGMRYCAPEIEAQQIHVAPLSPNSPDLHLIELCFGELVRRLDGFKVQSRSKEAKQMAIKHIQEIWQHDEEMRQFMADHLHPTAWVEVAEKCKVANGDNNFRG